MKDRWLFDGVAFFGDEAVKKMSGEAIAVYLRLLQHQWEEGDIPSDLRSISAICSDGVRHYTAASLAEPQGEPFVVSIWDMLSCRFAPVPGSPDRLVNYRMERERQQWFEKKKKAAEDGRIGGLKSAETRRRHKQDRSAPPDDRVSTPLEMSSAPPEDETNSELASFPLEATLKPPLSHPSREPQASSSSCSLSLSLSSRSKLAHARAPDGGDDGYVERVVQLFLKLTAQSRPPFDWERDLARSWQEKGIPLGKIEQILHKRLMTDGVSVRVLKWFSPIVDSEEFAGGSAILSTFYEEKKAMLAALPPGFESYESEILSARSSEQLWAIDAQIEKQLEMDGSKCEENC